MKTKKIKNGVRERRKAPEPVWSSSSNFFSELGSSHLLHCNNVCRQDGLEKSPWVHLIDFTKLRHQ